MTLGHFQMYQHQNRRDVRRVEEQEIENLFEKMMKGNFHNLVKEIDTSPGSTESSKQDGHKEDHTKTHHT